MKYRWLWAWLFQLVVMMIVCALQALSYGAGATVYAIATWFIVPLTGAVTAYLAVRHGLSNYLAWILPGLCMFAANYIVWGFSPSAGAALLCAFVSLIGAAAGEVANHRRGREGRRRA